MLEYWYIKHGLLPASELREQARGIKSYALIGYPSGQDGTIKPVRDHPPCPQETRFGQDGWILTPFFFWKFKDPKHAKKIGQYSVILTEQTWWITHMYDRRSTSKKLVLILPDWPSIIQFLFYSWVARDVIVFKNPKLKESPKLLSSSGMKGGKFISDMLTTFQLKNMRRLKPGTF